MKEGWRGRRDRGREEERGKRVRGRVGGEGGRGRMRGWEREDERGRMREGGRGWEREDERGWRVRPQYLPDVLRWY